MQSKETRAGINILNSVYNSKTQRKLQVPSPLQPVHCTVRVRCLTTTLSPHRSLARPSLYRGRGREDRGYRRTENTRRCLTMGKDP